MKVTLLDTETGDTREVSGIFTWNWHKGNWACDVNRIGYFDAEDEEDYGCSRFIVIDATIEDPEEDYEATIMDLNEDYPYELIAMHCPDRVPLMEGHPHYRADS